MSDYFRKVDVATVRSSSMHGVAVLDAAGFTLVELLVVLTIMAGLLAVAYPQFSRLYAGVRLSFEKNDVERQLLELPFKVRNSGQDGVLSNASAGAPPSRDAQTDPPGEEEDEPTPVIRLNLPAHWGMEIDKPIHYHLTGACDGGEVVFTIPSMSWRYNLAAPLCARFWPPQGSSDPMKTHRMETPQAGFTLIETIVALIILAGGLMAFYSFLSTALSAAGRVQAASIEYDRRMNALEIATALNPMASPQGSMDLGSYKIEWSSIPIVDPQQGSAFPLGKGMFKIGLYKMTFTFPGTRRIAPVEVTRMGYSRDKIVNPFAAPVN